MRLMAAKSVSVRFTTVVLHIQYRLGRGEGLFCGNERCLRARAREGFYCWRPLAARLGTWSWHRHLYITASLASSLVRILIITDHTPTEMYRDHR